MLAVEEVLSELHGEEVNEQGLPPGFRFHPTDEELITFYLASKVFNGSFCGVEIAEVDLNRCEPWELPDVAKMGEKEWYFFSLRDRKYPTGLRTNRATGAGYWKATGKDREVCSASSGSLLGMKKTLVFYKGRAPRGEKTKWVMHEYRLDGDFSYRHTCKEEWVICRIFHKAGDKTKNIYHHHQLEKEEALPPLIDSQSSPMIQNPFLNHDLKTLLASSHSQSFLFPMTNNNHNGFDHDHQQQSNSFLFKSLLSNQDFTLKEQVNNSGGGGGIIPKQCKTEANFSSQLLPDVVHNFSWMDKINNPNNQNQYPNSFLFDMDSFAQTGASSCTSTTAVNDMSTSLAFGFQVMLDPPITHNHLPRDSWPFQA